METVAELNDDEAREVRRFVEREHFLVDSTITIGGFGDEQRVWERDGALVRLTKDRGQWWCELSHRGCTDWFDLDLVAVAFGSKSYGPAERLGDVINNFTNDRLQGPLRAYRDGARHRT